MKLQQSEHMLIKLTLYDFHIYITIRVNRIVRGLV